MSINNLIKSLKNNKDAVIVIGDKAFADINPVTVTEQMNEVFNRKKMIKNPKEFWTYYKENLLKNYNMPKILTEIGYLIDNNLVKGVINLTSYHLTYSDKCKIINLKGSTELAKCLKCNKGTFIPNIDIDEITKPVQCECGGKIKPTLLMYGEEYLHQNYQDLKTLIFKEEDDKVTLNTHNLIFIGVDFEEDAMHELIESFNAVKEKNSEEAYTTLIAHMDGVSIDMYKPEFATYENIDDSLNRLITLLEGDNNE